MSAYFSWHLVTYLVVISIYLGICWFIGVRFGFTGLVFRPEFAHRYARDLLELPTALRNLIESTLGYDPYHSKKVAQVLLFCLITIGLGYTMLTTIG